MPTKLPRIFVTLPQALYDTVKRDAELNERSESSQVVWALRQYYEDMKKQVELFTSPQLHEAKRMEAPIFETPGQQALEPVLKPRAVHGREKS